MVDQKAKRVVAPENWGDADASRHTWPTLTRFWPAETLIGRRMQLDCSYLAVQAMLFLLRAEAAVRRETAVHIQMDAASGIVFHHYPTITSSHSHVQIITSYINALKVIS